MNEFAAHILKNVDYHETAIRKLSKMNRKNAFILAILTGVALYQSMRISDLKFDLDRLSKKVDDIEKDPTIQNNYFSE